MGLQNTCFAFNKLSCKWVQINTLCFNQFIFIITCTKVLSSVLLQCLYISLCIRDYKRPFLRTFHLFFGEVPCDINCYFIVICDFLILMFFFAHFYFAYYCFFLSPNINPLPAMFWQLVAHFESILKNFFLKTIFYSMIKFNTKNRQTKYCNNSSH